MSTLNQEALIYTTKKCGIAPKSVLSTLSLIINEQCTVPFIARYRKEATQNLDEVQIRQIHEAYEEYIEIEKRRAFILENIEKMEALTPDLKKQILSCTTLNQLEDIYAPFKSKKKTKAMIARELGLEPLAQLLLESELTAEQLKPQIEKDFVLASGGKVKTLEEALQGALDILSEKISHDLELKDKFRSYFWSHAVIKSSVRTKAQEIEDYHKYQDFFEFNEPIQKISQPKSSHRYLALRRGMNQKVLKVDIEIQPEVAYAMIEEHLGLNKGKRGNLSMLKKLVTKVYDQNILTSLDLEFKNELKKIADTHAIDVFGVNLKNLLLQPYLGAKAVMGIDPGIRTGCKVVLIDNTGKFIGDHVIYPFAPRNDITGSATILNKMIEAFNIEYICIGNGTNGRETLEFVETYLPQVQNKKVKATIISEAGASIYSASDIAREEFPDKDVTVRGAISIARRFQDPLAELVKLDPKSIGVGQYQHDVNQIQLKNSLEKVVESCVNYVGVDLNTASAPLLSYISGIGPTVAQNIVKFREAQKGFKSRTDLLKVPRFSQKIYEQSAGFLRIYNGSHPLDSTFIHPERYITLENWIKNKNTTMNELVQSLELQNQLAQDKNLISEMGELTLQDILKSLRAPTQDPRTVFTSVEFTKGIKELKDLKIGTWYNGVISNITMFGAFVDIGIKENGLLHISEMSHEFVQNATDKFKVGMEVKVKIISIDFERKRIALSAKPDSDHRAYTDPSRPKLNSTPKMPVDQPIKNNAFGALRNLKIK